MFTFNPKVLKGGVLVRLNSTNPIKIISCPRVLLMRSLVVINTTANSVSVAVYRGGTTEEFMFSPNRSVNGNQTAFLVPVSGSYLNANEPLYAIASVANAANIYLDYEIPLD